MPEFIVKSVNGKQGFVTLDTDDIIQSDRNLYMSIEEKMLLGKLSLETKDLRTHIYDNDIHIDTNILNHIQINITHRQNEVVHLDKGLKKKIKDHLISDHDGRRGLRGLRGHPGPPGGGSNVRVGTVDGQMLYWNNTTRIWETSVVTDLGWDNTEKLLTIGSTDPSTKSPGVSFRTSKVTANRIDLILDENSSHDRLMVVGKTPLKNTFFEIKALDGEDAYLIMYSGGSYSLIGHDSLDDFNIMGTGEDRDMIFSINDGSVVKEVLRLIGATAIVNVTTDLTVVGTSELAVTNIGDGTNKTQFSATGFQSMFGSAMSYNDLQFSVTPGKSPPAGVAPTWEAFTTNTSEYAFSVNDHQDLQANEVPHSWAEGTAGKLHVHFTIKDPQNDGADRGVKFSAWVAYADSNEVWVEQVVISAEKVVPTGSNAMTNFYLALGDVILTNYLIGAQIKLRIKRIAATTSTEYNGEIYITQVGMHMLDNTIGSSSELTK